ncbi:MAG: DegV family protein, partial [Calditrichaceae bacterium]
VIGQKRVFRKTLRLAIEFAESVKNPRFSVAHVLAREKAEWYRDELLKIFSEAEIHIMDASPALGVHAGPGSAAIAVLGDR